MDQTTKQYEYFQDPTADLEFAIKILESINTSQNLTQSSQSIFQTALNIAKKWLGLTFSNRIREYNIRRKEMLHQRELVAIDHFKRHYLRIPKLLKGNPEQQKLAKRALETIKNYNHQDPNQNNWPDRFLTFLIQKSGISFLRSKIDLPVVTIEISDETSHKITFLIKQESFTPDITTQEKDLFRMKAISLMKSHGYFSIEEVMRLVKETPINAAIPESSIVTLHQTLSPFPGETIILKGSFRRDSKSHRRSTPIPATFELSTNSSQTGYPLHPLLHTGWAVPDRLIPNNLHHPDHLNHTHRILKRKKQTAKDLNPDGKLIGTAKEHLKQKRKIFKDHSEHLLQLHQTLCLSLLNASSNNPIPQSIERMVHDFFIRLKKTPSPIETLADTYQSINEICASRPLDLLHQTWLEHTNHELLSTSPKRRYQAASTIMEREVNKMISEIQSEFIRHLVLTLAPAFRDILLQHLSEMIQYPPPVLSTFEQKIQAITYQHLESFLNHILTIPSKEDIVHEIDRDIAILQSESNESSYVSELERYYQRRCIGS